MPGKTFPSKNSKQAPPPVEIWVILSSSPNLIMALAVSPPPIIVVAFKRDINSATFLVPLAKASISNIPSGPFQTIFFFCFLKRRTVCSYRFWPDIRSQPAVGNIFTDGLDLCINFNFISYDIVNRQEYFYFLFFSFL